MSRSRVCVKRNPKERDGIVLTKNETAKLLKISPRTLDRLHLNGTGPGRCSVGRQPRYLRESVLTWLQQQVAR